MSNDDFFSEEKLDTFEGWLEYQRGGIPISAEEVAELRKIFEQLKANPAPKVELMKLARVPGECKYAVAINDGSDLWLTLWVKRSKKGEVFVMVPRADRAWDPHTSYHLDGTLHSKSYGRAGFTRKLQPLNGTFRGTEHLGYYAGHGT